MKRNTKILIKTTSLVLAFMLLLGAGIMSLSFSHSGVKTNDSNFLTPDLAINAPTSQELLQRKFNAYNIVTEENGKSVITIFSEAQIADFNERRNNGGWFSLSAEEALFLISDTEQLFEKYDEIRITDLSGKIKTYMVEQSGTNKEKYKQISELVFDRIKVLNSATYNYLNLSIFFTDTGEECENNSPYKTIVDYFEAFPKSDQTELPNELAKYPAYGAFLVSNDTQWLDQHIVYLPNITDAKLYNLKTVYTKNQ